MEKSQLLLFHFVKILDCSHKHTVSQKAIGAVTGEPCALRKCYIELALNSIQPTQRCWLYQGIMS